VQVLRTTLTSEYKQTDCAMKKGFVTGASSGIGLIILKALTAPGDEVFSQRRKRNSCL
jgi:NAD(P)-dependent dehydrogenase (short-subunit alcohol dehydrogenase family)